MGVGTTVGEYIVINLKVYWRVANNKWYSIRFKGNKYAGSRSVVLSNAKMFRIGGYRLFGLSSFVAGTQAYQGVMSRNFYATTKAGFDFGVGLYGLLFGPLGVGDSLGWWGLALAGGF